MFCAGDRIHWTAEAIEKKGIAVTSDGKPRTAPGTVLDPNGPKNYYGSTLLRVQWDDSLVQELVHPCWVETSARLQAEKDALDRECGPSHI